jgi:hypothetical protein
MGGIFRIKKLEPGSRVLSARDTTPPGTYSAIQPRQSTLTTRAGVVRATRTLLLK